jgi:hypothetical protein
MPEDTPEIDWDGIRLASISLAEVLWSFSAALKASGFNEEEVLALTIEYMKSWMLGIAR